jgi:SAM-dependent methyltransferase
MSKVFGDYSKYYDLLYQDKDYNAEVDYLCSLIGKFSSNPKKIAEFGSGSGKHGKLLAKRGYEISGIERSQEMILQSREEPLSNEVTGSFGVVQGDITNTKVGSDFDVVISLFHVISYLTKNKQLVECFSNAANHLKRGGLFVFDIWYSPAVYHIGSEPRLKELENDTIGITRFAKPIAYPNENRIEVHYNIHINDKQSNQLRTLSEVHSMRHFSLPEIELLAEHTGFQLIHSEEWITAAKPSEKTWGICIVLQKK